MAAIKLATWISRTPRRIALLVSAFLYMPSAFAQYNLILLPNVASGYSACSWSDNGNGKSVITLTISYLKDVVPLYSNFWSRGILVYTYDRNGLPNPTNNVASDLALNGVRNASYYAGQSYVMYNGTVTSTEVLAQWGIRTPFDATVTFTIDNSLIKSWPAVAVRAGNFTSRDDVGEVSGAAYISRDGQNGSCTVIPDPDNPPTPDITVSLNAPDWNLGELPFGYAEKAFASTAEQLCFDYPGASDASQTFIINATGQNGTTADHRYRLRNVDDPSQEVPYSLDLSDGVTTFSLPNRTETGFTLNGSGRTCFVPTFKTTVDEKLKDGAYNDVLQFTVTTKS